MMSKKLIKARKYEIEKGREILQSDRPLFHISPYIGWMNDPNGFSYYNGQYHMFYQYNPYDTVWGPMHWGHIVSENLVDWKFLPTALAPDSKSDKKGCFSGCAIPTKDGRLALFYTGVQSGKDEKGQKSDLQVQVLAYGDGQDFTKIKNNPVIKGNKLKKGWSVKDFRDPKIVFDGQLYKVFCVNRKADGLGQIISFTSDDLENWSFDRVVLENDGNHGIMWECPDLLNIDGQDVLMFSLQNQISNTKFTAGNVVVYALKNEKNGFACDNLLQLDYGIDFYAHQTVKAPDGRTILIAWLQNWDTCGYRNPSEKWFGQGTIPRELKIQNGIILQQPVKEIENKRCNKIESNVVCPEGKPVSIPGVDGIYNDIIIEADCKEFISGKKIQIRLFEKNDNFLLLEYDFYSNEIVLDRTNCGSDKAFQHRVCKRYDKLNTGDTTLKIRIIQDRNSVEAFLGDGELAISMAVYNREIRDGIKFYADSSINMKVIAYKLEGSK